MLWIMLAATLAGATPSVEIDTPLPPPAWALLERQLIDSNSEACRQFFARYFDDRGYLECVERWGGDDGPDDAIECLKDWTLLYSLGGDADVLDLYYRAWEGHLRQYTEARTQEVPFARDGMYYKEFPVTMDWFHNGEGLCVFNVEGLCDPRNARFVRRLRRFAGFYMGEEPGADNYDPQHKMIRSLFNGSRGPLMRRATAVDWAGDTIEIEHRFPNLRHREKNYAEMLEHFREYNDIIGDNPLNLVATTLPTNAFLVTGEPKYRDWVLEYVGAWRDRMEQNGNIIPTKIGLDGKIGGPVEEGRATEWYDGVYGWAFTITDTETGKPVHRNGHYRGFLGFQNALLLSGDMGFIDIWRKQREVINSQKKVVNGETVYPHMYGKEGWYDFNTVPYNHNARSLWLASFADSDRQYVAQQSWVRYLAGDMPQYPEQALQGDLELIRRRVAEFRADRTTPDTRLSDDPMLMNPASIDSLLELATAGETPQNWGGLFFSRLRYFDPARRRPGLPRDVAALVDSLTADQLTVTLVNTNPVAERKIIVQAGSYAEHQFTGLLLDGKSIPLDASHITVTLRPGCGGKLVLKTRRYVNTPTLQMPEM